MGSRKITQVCVHVKKMFENQLIINFPKYALKTTSDLIFIHINRHTYHALSLHPKFSLNHSEDIYANYDFIIYVHLYNL